MSEPLTPETLAEWRADAERSTYYGGIEQEQAERILALLDALDEAEATLARIEALATEWAYTRFYDDYGDGYDSGRDDQIDRCEQQLRAVLDGREPSETTRDE